MIVEVRCLACHVSDMFYRSCLCLWRGCNPLRPSSYSQVLCPFHHLTNCITDNTAHHGCPVLICNVGVQHILPPARLLNVRLSACNISTITHNTFIESESEGQDSLITEKLNLKFQTCYLKSINDHLDGRRDKIIPLF